EADRRGLHPVRLEHDARLYDGAGGARLHARPDDRRVSAVAPGHPDAAGGPVLQCEREQLEPLDPARATRGRGVQERRGNGPTEKRALHRLTRGGLPSQSHLRRHLPLSGRHELPAGQAAVAVRSGAARVRGGAGGRPRDRRLPAQMGYDSDHPMAEGEVGRAGVAIDTVDDLARLFDGIPLDRVSTSMTINATAAVLLAMYVVVGEEHGVGRSKLQGTVQNDILKEFIARGTYIYPIEPSLRLATDVCRFVTIEGMSFNPISVSGYHMREAGATAAQELAFTFANGLEYVRRAVAAGLDVDQFAPRLSFFFAAFTDLFEEIAKFRA